MDWQPYKRAWAKRIDFIAIPPPSPDPITVAVVAIIDVLGIILALFGLGAQGAINNLSTAMQSGFSMVDTQFTVMGEYANGIFRELGQFLKGLWNVVIIGLIKKLFALLKQLHDWLEARLAPIISFLAKVLHYLDTFFKTYIKPFLNMLQHIRGFLNILRAFGVKWAARLDARLGQIETTISQYFLAVRGVLTGVIGLLNILADPSGLLRRPTQVLSIRRTLNSTIRLATGMPPGFFFPSPAKSLLPGLGNTGLAAGGVSTGTPPLASSYLGGDDGLGSFNGFTNGDIPDNTDVDSASPLDYFNDDLYPGSPCADAASCLQSAYATQLKNPAVTA